MTDIYENAESDDFIFPTLYWTYNVNCLKTQIKEQEMKMTKTCETIAELIRGQLLTICNLAEKKENLESMCQEEKMSRSVCSYQPAPTCSKYTYNILKEEIDQCEGRNRILDSYIKQAKTDLTASLRKFPSAIWEKEIRGKAQQETAKLETIVQNTRYTMDKLVKSITKLCVDINSIMRLRIAFHKKYRLVKKHLVSKNMKLKCYSSSLDRPLKGKHVISGLYHHFHEEELIEEELRDIRHLLETNKTYLKFKGSPMVLHSADILNLDIPFKEKLSKCSNIITGVQDMSLEKDVIAICRKYMENEADIMDISNEMLIINNEIEQTMLDMAGLRPPINSLKTELSKKQGLISPILKVTKQGVEDLCTISQAYETETDEADRQLCYVKSILYEIVPYGTAKVFSTRTRTTSYKEDMLLEVNEVSRKIIQLLRCLEYVENCQSK